MSVTNKFVTLLYPSGTEFNTENGSSLDTLSSSVSVSANSGSVFMVSRDTSVSFNHLRVSEDSLGTLSSDSNLPYGSVDSSNSVFSESSSSSVKNSSPLIVESGGSFISVSSVSDRSNLTSSESDRFVSSLESASGNSYVSQVSRSSDSSVSNIDSLS